MISDPGFLKELSKYLDRHGHFLLFVLDRKGTILHTNIHARDLLGEDMITGKFQDILVDFSGVFNMKLFENDPESEHLLHIQTSENVPHSYFFKFGYTNEYIIALGQQDSEELELMREEVLSLNRELNNLTRLLHKQNAQLATLNQEKNRFLGMAAHDLRKPIGLIMSYSEFLIEEAAEVLGSEHLGFLSTVLNSCRFMQNLVDDFLDISAIEAGKFDLNLQIVDISEVLERSLELNRIQARKKQIELAVSASEGTIVVELDPGKIEQVITNLVSNAIEHSDEASQINIKVTTDIDSLTVSIQDSGHGIPAEDIDKIFKPFEKSTAPKTAGEKSTGLGMMIARKIIEAHNGRIWVNSTVGEGATFFFTLPKTRDNHGT